MIEKLKMVEVMLCAISALVTAAKAIIKFIGYVSKLMEKKPAKATA